MGATNVQVSTADGVMSCHTFQPEGEGAWPGVIVYMDAFGLRPQLDEMGQRLASNGYFVVVPDLYHRAGAFEPFKRDVVITEGPERNRFMGMIKSINGALVMRDTAAVIGLLDRTPSVRKGAFGAVGYCMGGGYALSAAGTFPDRVAAAASFHGGSLATDRSDSPHLLAGEMRAQLYIGVAEIDPGFSAEQSARLEHALKEAGVHYTLEVYDGAKHGFAVTGHLVYDHDASERHWRTLLELFRSAL
jgi:carboxymethylenebutenolidase